MQFPDGPEVDARTLLNVSLAAVCVCERDSGKILHANRVMRDLLGRSAEELRELDVIQVGLWDSAEQRRTALEENPYLFVDRTVQLGPLSVRHGWQPAQLDGRQVLAEVVVDVSVTAEGEARLERMGNFRRILSEVVRESLKHGSEVGFHSWVLEQLVETIEPAEAASLLVQSDDGLFRFEAAAGYDMEMLKRVWLAKPYSNNLPEGEPTLVRGFERVDESLDDERRGWLEASGRPAAIKVTIVTPISIDERSLAILHVDNFSDADAFDEEAVSMARDFAQHLGVMLQRRKLEEALRQQAHYDKLTGLPNRRYFDDKLSKAVSESNRTGRQVALFLIDIDGFKQVNDRFGHAFGDRLVQVVTRRLSNRLPPGASLSRWGGDELAMIVPDPPDPELLDRQLQLLLDEVKRPINLDDQELVNTISIGGCHYPRYAASPGSLLMNADSALYRAKNTGRNRFVIFDEELNARVALERDIRDPGFLDQVELWYHPRIDVATRTVCGVEALARWNHPLRGLVSAAEFIPLAEEQNVLGKLGMTLLDHACAQLRRWLDQGLSTMLSFNVSRFELSQPDFVESVVKLTQRHNVATHMLELQITEDAVVRQVPDAAEKLQRLSSVGFRLLLDDIQSGYASLAVLRQFRLDAFKISREYVTALEPSGTNTGAVRVIETVTALGRDLGVTVVAEGVETSFQRDMLIAAGCAQLQGFLFSPVLSAEEATVRLRPAESQTA